MKFWENTQQKPVYIAKLHSFNYLGGDNRPNVHFNKLDLIRILVYLSTTVFDTVKINTNTVFSPIQLLFIPAD